MNAKYYFSIYTGGEGMSGGLLGTWPQTAPFPQAPKQQKKLNGYI